MNSSPCYYSVGKIVGWYFPAHLKSVTAIC